MKIHSLNISLFYTLSLFFTMIVMSSNAQHQKKRSFDWNQSKKKQYIKNREDSLSWSKKNLSIDMKDLEISGKPMIEGVFPVPDYRLSGSKNIAGNGNTGNYTGIRLKDKTIIYNGFYIGKSDINQDYIGDKPDELYFIIVTLTDSIAKDGYSHMESTVSSRNYPDFIGQGSIKTKTNQIDFIAFLTADRNNYAMVNLRLFDLKLGRIILIAPQKDGSLRSMQLQDKQLASNELEPYVTELLKRNEIITFFTNKNNI